MNTNEKSYFDNHPSVETFYFTSDGYAFYNENDAVNHAAKLGDDEVLKVDKPLQYPQEKTEE